MLKFKTSNDYEPFIPITLKYIQQSNSQLLYEQSLKFVLKMKRASNQQLSKDLSAYIMDHFVHREITKKLKEQQELEDMEELVYRLPFKMKV